MKFLNDITQFSTNIEDEIMEILQEPSPFLPHLNIKVYTVSDSLQNITTTTNQGSQAVINAIHRINNFLSLPQTVFLHGDNYLIIDDSVYIVDNDLDRDQLLLLESIMRCCLGLSRGEA